MLLGLCGLSFVTLSGVTAALDTLLGDWNEAVNLSADGHADAARQLLTERQAAQAVADIGATAQTTLQRAQGELGGFDDRIRLGTLAVLVLQVLSGTLAMSGMFFAFRSSAREAFGRWAALKSADTSREQVARLFEMAVVLLCSFVFVVVF